MRHGEIRALTGIRGLAVCWVILYHLQVLNCLFHDKSPFLMPIVHGYLAVDLFFMLSGFILGYTYKDYVIQGWTPTRFSAFMVRRFARIYPLYIIVLCVMVGLILWRTGHMVGLALFLENAALIQSWGFQPEDQAFIWSINPPTWSVSTELGAYLIFPLLAFPALKLRGRYAMLTGLAAVASLFFMQFAQAPVNGLQRPPHGPLDIAWVCSTLPLLRCIAGFTLGILMYRLSNDASVRQSMQEPWIVIFFLVLFVTLLFIPGSDLRVLLLMLPLLLALATNGNFVSCAMSSHPFYFLGEISYSIYLVHWPLLELRAMVANVLVPHIGSVSANAAALAIFFIATLCCSYFTYRFIEKPCRNGIRRWEEKRLEGKQI